MRSPQEQITGGVALRARFFASQCSMDSDSMESRSTSCHSKSSHGPIPSRALSAWLVAFTLLLSASTPLVAEESLANIGTRLARELRVDQNELAFCVRTPSGEVVGHRAGAPMIPASNMKVVTAVAALELLGEEFQLSTDLRIRGELVDGVLDGDLIIVGRGDPSVSGRYTGGDPLQELRVWCGMLQELGVKKVKGRLVADVSYLAGASRLPEWPERQLHRWYCAPSGALNLNDNCVDVRFKVEGGAAPTVAVSLSPENPLFELHGRVTATAKKKKHTYRVDRAHERWSIVVGGTFFTGVQEHTEPVTVPDPTRAYLGAVRKMFEDSGIEIHEVVLGDSKGSRLAHRLGHPVASTIPVLLKRSQNLYGDCLLRVVGREQGGDGSYESGAHAVTRYLKDRVSRADGFVIRDGSGLSRRNRVDCRSMVQLLEHARSRPWGDNFAASLPIAGRDGTLRNRFRKSTLAGRVHAKTGYLDGIRALSGYLHTDQGVVTFSLIYNGSVKGSAASKRWQGAFLEAVLERYSGSL